MSRGYSFRIASVAALAWLAVLFVFSDNLHSRLESTSYDRLMLGMRLCFGDGPLGDGSTVDPNFPLGSALLYAIPCMVGIPSVPFGRALSFGFAVFAAGLAVRLVRASGGGAREATVTVLGLAAVPALARGAVVVGEEAAYTAALMGVVLGAAQGRTTWVLLGANLAALVRLDAFTWVPFAALWVASMERGRRRALAVLAFGTTVVHLLVGWRGSGGWNGDPLGFARVARETMQRSAGGFGGALDVWSFPTAMVSALGGTGVVGLLVAGLVAFAAHRGLRSDGGRAMTVALVGLVIIDWVLSTLGAFEPRSHRMLAPALALMVVAAARAPGLLGPTAVLALLVFGAPRSWTQAHEERLPEGLVDAARIAGERPLSEPLATNEQHPVVVVESGRPPGAVQLGPTPPKGTRWWIQASETRARLEDLDGR